METDGMEWNLNLSSLPVREAAKKVLIVSIIKKWGGGGWSDKGLPLKRNNFFLGFLNFL